MEMHQLRYFAKVAELGNIARAAEACFVSQPSLSQQLAKLEQELVCIPAIMSAHSGHRDH